MKNVILAVCVAACLSGVALAGDCVKCQPTQAVVTQTVEVTKTVVTAPVRVVGGWRTRVAARRAVRQAVREATVCSTCCETAEVPAEAPAQ